MMLGLSLALTSPVVLRRAGPVIPPWVPEGAALAADLANNRYWSQPMASYSSFADFAAAGHAGFARASVAYMPNAAGVYVPFSSGQLRRIDGIGTMLEPASTNLVVYNNSIVSRLGANWFATALNVTEHDNDRFGKVVRLAKTTATSSTFLTQNNVVSASGTYTRSVFVRGDGSESVDLRTHETNSGAWSAARLTFADGAVAALGAAVAADRDVLGDGWYRLWLRSAYDGSDVANKTAVRLNNTNAIGSAVEIAWPQAEVGSRVTSPIITGADATARAADALTLNPPGAGAYDWVATYDDDSTSVIPAHAGPLAVNPTTLASPVIKTIIAEAA